MKSRIAKGLATLGLVGLLAGCSHNGAPEPQDAKKELKLWGYVEDRPRITLSHDFNRNQNTVRLNIRLGCERVYGCENLDLRYHGENGREKTITADLELGANIPSLSKGDAVHFALTEGFNETGKLAVGDPLYRIDTMPAKGRLLEYFK